MSKEKTEIVEAKVDEEVISEVKKVLDEKGLDIETAIELFFKEVVKNKGIDFLDNN